ncbi:MAG: hypothetical protein IJ594_10840, partial [Oscillospiraceae bacterium]|nr:hypothetical protein [Oscillospiraceae bacterium]
CGQGEHTVRVEMDPIHLSSGQYTADLVAYLHDEKGKEDILDGVYPGVIFQISDPIDAENYLDWHHQYWGAVRLHDLEVREE